MRVSGSRDRARGGVVSLLLREVFLASDLARIQI